MGQFPRCIGVFPVQSAISDPSDEVCSGALDCARRRRLIQAVVMRVVDRAISPGAGCAAEDQEREPSR